MKGALKVLFMLVSSAAVYADSNDIYITQSGTGLTLTIDQIGDGNVVGTSQTRATFTGTSMTVDVDQVGDSNTLAASIAQGNSTSFTVTSTGDSNQTTLAFGASGDVANTDFDLTETGDQNVVSFVQGADATATAGNQDITITGTSNNINATCEVVGCINNWTVDGDANDIDSSQTGNADHQITASITGNTNNIDIDQTNSTGSVFDVGVITATTSNATIDVDQCTSGC